MKKTFEEWYEEVDRQVQRLSGLNRDDLPDCLYWDWYEDEVNPTTAAKRAIRNAKDS